jgi:hypothetical protein
MLGIGGLELQALVLSLRLLQLLMLRRGRYYMCVCVYMMCVWVSCQRGAQ